MNTEKKLGKIRRVKFGHVGYQDACLGIQFEFSFDGTGICTDYSAWDPEMIECNESSTWTEEDRDKQLAKIMRKISKLMKQAKVHNVNDLQGVPVEVIIKNQRLEDWRILTEVL